MLPLPNSNSEPDIAQRSLEFHFGIAPAGHPFPERSKVQVRFGTVRVQFLSGDIFIRCTLQCGSRSPRHMLGIHSRDILGSLDPDSAYRIREKRDNFNGSFEVRRR